MSEARSATRRGGLDGAYEVGVHAASGAVGVTFDLRVGISQVNLRGEPQAASAESMFPLPRAPNDSVGVPGGDVLWLGPDEWLLSTERPVPELLARWHGAATDVSHGRCVLRIGGTAVRELLAVGISLDLHPRAFASGGCAQTRFSGVGVLVHRLRDCERFDVYVPRSYALHVWEMLRAAADEFGYEAR